MKPLHIVLLVCAGALGGAVVTKVWQKHPTPSAPVPVVAQVQTPAPAVQTPAATPPAAPAAVEEPKPSPVAEPASPAPAENTPAPQVTVEKSKKVNRAPVKWHKNPPPAHPRPLELGKAAPPPQPPVSAPPAAAPAAPQVQEAPPAPVHQPEPPQAAAPPAAPEPEPPHRVTLNAGMLIPVRLVDGLSSERNAAGDVFTGTLDRELVVDGFVIAERGARVQGRVVAADSGTKVKGNASITVELTRIHTSDGQDVAIQTESFERRADTDHRTDAAKVGGGAVLGAIIGAIAGGGKGAAIGAGVGGGAGAGDVLLTRKPATLPSETRISFRLRTPVTLTERRG